MSTECKLPQLLSSNTVRLEQEPIIKTRGQYLEKKNSKFEQKINLLFGFDDSPKAANLLIEKEIEDRKNYIEKTEIELHSLTDSLIDDLCDEQMSLQQCKAVKESDKNTKKSEKRKEKNINYSLINTIDNSKICTPLNQNELDSKLNYTKKLLQKAKQERFLLEKLLELNKILTCNRPNETAADMADTQTKENVQKRDKILSFIQLDEDTENNEDNIQRKLDQSKSFIMEIDKSSHLPSIKIENEKSVFSDEFEKGEINEFKYLKESSTPNLRPKSSKNVKAPTLTPPTFEYIGNYDKDGNFYVRKQRVKYEYRNINGRKIQYRIPDIEIFEAKGANDLEGTHTFEHQIEYEAIGIKNNDGSIQTILRPIPEYELRLTSDGKMLKVQKKFHYEKIGKNKYKKSEISNGNDYLMTDVIAERSGDEIMSPKRKRINLISPISLQNQQISPDEAFEASANNVELDLEQNEDVINDQEFIIPDYSESAPKNLQKIETHNLIVVPSKQSNSPRRLQKKNSQPLFSISSENNSNSKNDKSNHDTSFTDRAERVKDEDGAPIKPSTENVTSETLAASNKAQLTAYKGPVDDQAQYREHPENNGHSKNDDSNRQTTDKIVGNVANGLLDGGDGDSSEDEKTVVELPDAENAGNNNEESYEYYSDEEDGKPKKIHFNFIFEYANIICDHLDDALGRPRKVRPPAHKRKRRTKNIQSREIAPKNKKIDLNERPNTRLSVISDVDYSESYSEDKIIIGEDGQQITVKGTKHKTYHDNKELGIKGREYTTVDSNGNLITIKIRDPKTIEELEEMYDSEVNKLKKAQFDEEEINKLEEEEKLKNAKRERSYKKHREIPNYEYDLTDDNNFEDIIKKRVTLYERVEIERNGKKSIELVKKPPEAKFEYIEIEAEDGGTKLVKNDLECHYEDMESEGGKIRSVFCPVEQEVEFEWYQREDDPTTIEKIPKKWGYRWTYDTNGRRRRVRYDPRSFIQEESFDWKGNPITTLKKLKMETVDVECDDGVVRQIKRPIEKIEFEFVEEENPDGTFSIVKKPTKYRQLENGSWKRIEDENDFFVEQIEVDGKMTLEKRKKVYEVVEMECEDGIVRKIRREVQPVEYDEIVDEKGKKTLKPRTVDYEYVLVQTENGVVKVRRQVMNDSDKFEYIGQYDDEGNFVVQQQKVRYGYRTDFNGRRIRYRIEDKELVEDYNGEIVEKAVEYETVEVQLEDGTIQKVLRKKEEVEYVMETDENGNVRYVKQKVEYTTTQVTDKDGNVVTVRKKVNNDFDEIQEIDEEGNVVFKKVEREYETVTMKGANGETITVRRAKKYNFEKIVDENGVEHLIRREKIKPKRVRKSVKRLISFPKPKCPRSKSFSYFRRYPKRIEKELPSNASVSNLGPVLLALKKKNLEDSQIFENFTGFRNNRDFYRKILHDALARRVKKAQLDIQITNAQVDLSFARCETQEIGDEIDFVWFEIRSKLPKLRLSRPNQITVKKPPIDGPDVFSQTDLTSSQLADFHMQVKKGVLTNQTMSTLKDNNQTLSDYLNKLERDHKRLINDANTNEKLGDDTLAEIRLYKPTPDSVAMPPETRKRIALQSNYQDLRERADKLGAELEKKIAFIRKARAKENDSKCTLDMKKRKVTELKMEPKVTIKELRERSSTALQNEKKVGGKMTLAEIEEENLDERIEIFGKTYSKENIDNTIQSIQKMKILLEQYKQQFITNKKVKTENEENNNVRHRKCVYSTKTEMAEFEKRRKGLAKKISTCDKSEIDLTKNINGLLKVMKHDHIRIPVDRMVTILMQDSD